MKFSHKVSNSSGTVCKSKAASIKILNLEQNYFFKLDTGTVPLYRTYNRNTNLPVLHKGVIFCPDETTSLPTYGYRYPYSAILCAQ
jgi:hypothetical protein